MCAKKVRKHPVALHRPIGPYSGSRPEVMQWGDRDERWRTLERMVEEDDLDEETALRVARKMMTWREWFMYDLLRYWYWFGGFALVTFFVIQVSWTYHVRDPMGLSVLALVAFLIITLEFYFYKVIWPQGALTALTQGWPAGRRLRRAIRRLRWRL